MKLTKIENLMLNILQHYFNVYEKLPIENTHIYEFIRFRGEYKLHKYPSVRYKML